jgi:hypothetical protein
VLQLLTSAGATVAFAKLGTNELTRGLVRAETAALRKLGAAALRQVSVPAVRHAGCWHGHEILVQAALPVWRRRASLPADRRASAMREVAVSGGVTRAQLAGSAYWGGLTARLSTVADRPEGYQLARAADRLGVTAGDIPLEFGSWHGDWAPWNMRPVDDTVLVWDWERFTTGVPMGFDNLHYDLQQRVSTRPDGATAVRQSLAAAAELLAPFDVTEPAAVRLTALLYLIDLATRYVTDRQAEAGARLGVLGQWLLPVLVSTVEVL